MCRILREQTKKPVGQGGLSGGAGRNSPVPEQREVARLLLPRLHNPPNCNGGAPPGRGRGQARQYPPPWVPVNSLRGGRQDDLPVGVRNVWT